MLIGQYEHNIDKKGRVFIPAKLKEGIGERFVVSKGLDGNHCLFLYSIEEWKHLEEKISALPFSKSRQLQRFLYAGAAELECDAQGRVCIPATLRLYASLEAASVIVGVSNHIEIWNSENWRQEEESYGSEDIVSLLEDIGF